MPRTASRRRHKYFPHPSKPASLLLPPCFANVSRYTPFSPFYERLLTPSQWLRSCVVSVLFSLTAEMSLWRLLRSTTFWIDLGPLSLLMPSISVASIALHLADANNFSSISSLHARTLEKTCICDFCHVFSNVGLHGSPRTPP